MKKVNAERNCPKWVSNEKDYQLVFCEVDGYWRECGHNIPKYANMLLADYLSLMCLSIPDYTQFMRIIAPNYRFEYRSCVGSVSEGKGLITIVFAF